MTKYCHFEQGEKSLALPVVTFYRFAELEAAEALGLGVGLCFKIPDGLAEALAVGLGASDGLAVASTVGTGVAIEAGLL